MTCPSEEDSSETTMTTERSLVSSEVVVAKEDHTELQVGKVHLRLGLPQWVLLEQLFSCEQGAILFSEHANICHTET